MSSGSLGQFKTNLDIRLAAPLGRYNGWLTQNKFGKNGAVSTVADIWSTGGALTYLSSAETMDVSSSQGADKGTPTASTGARTVTLYGVDGDYGLVQETVTLDGTNPVTTTQDFLRLYRMTVDTAGTGGANAGIISAVATTASTTQSEIEVGENQTQMSHYTVPDGYYALVNNFHMSIQKGDQAVVQAFVRPFGGVFQLKRTYEIFQQTVLEQINPAILVPPKADMVIRGTRISGGASVSITASYDFYLVPSDQVNV